METTLTKEQKDACHVVIHSSAIAAATVGAGLAQLPLSDSALLIPIQMTMVISLGKIFQVHITDSAANGMSMGLVGMYFGRTFSQILVGWIPGLGNAINATTAASITESIGWAVVSKFVQENTKVSNQ